MVVKSFFNKLMVRTQKAQAGFTIIELVVIITIFAVMSSIMLFNFNGFNKNIERNNLAQDIGLLIRKAQSYGIASSTLGSAATLGDESLPSRYGLLFDYDATAGIAGTVTNIVLYKKILTSSNQSVGFTSSDVVIDTVTIASPGLSVVVCTPTNISTCATPIPDDVAIEFERPKPDPLVSSPGDIPFVIRLLPADPSATWYIVVASTGDIYVKHQ